MKLHLLTSLTSRGGGDWRECNDANDAPFLSNCVAPSSTSESIGGGVGSRKILCLRTHLLNSNSIDQNNCIRSLDGLDYIYAILRCRLEGVISPKARRKSILSLDGTAGIPVFFSAGKQRIGDGEHSSKKSSSKSSSS